MKKLLFFLSLISCEPSVFCMAEKKNPQEEWATLAKNYEGFGTRKERAYIVFGGWYKKGEKEMQEDEEPDITLQRYHSNALNLKEKNIASTAKEQIKKEMQEEAVVLAGTYKIHLMPQDDAMNYMVEELLKLIAKNKELQDLIIRFKVRSEYEKTKEEQKKGKEHILPRIVMYPIGGKAHAQKVLNAVYANFKDIPGIDITPRYNAKVTSLIYAAQGDADFKNDTYKKYYESSRIYYNKKEIPPVKPDKDHYLKHPETGKDLKK
ncbi:MAG: hypothetical protein AB7R69_04150 [Candidatus Babeliales bacterium]